MKTRILMLVLNALLVSPPVIAQVAAEAAPYGRSLDLSLPRDFVAESRQSPSPEISATLPEMGGVQGVGRRNELPNYQPKELPYGAGYEARQRGAEAGGHMAGKGRAGRRGR